MERLIQSTISALGFLEGDVYHKEPDCYASSRDLIRYLRNDTPDGLARRLCGERNIVENDLVPILKSSDDDPQLFDVALRLLINLTQPANALFEGQPPKDRASWEIYAQLVRNLQNSKQAFADVQLFTVLGKRLKAFVELEWENRQEEERLVIERILTLLRYVFAIPNTEQDRQRADTDVNSQDQLIWALLDAKVDEILLFIASRQSERDFHIAVLEIFALILKEHSPPDLVSAGTERTAEQKREAEQQLATTVVRECEKVLATARRLPARHSNFAGSYTIKGLKAVNATKDVVVGRAVKDVDKLEWMEDRKAKRRTPKNRRPFDGADRTHRSALNVRLRLKELCMRLLETAYNRLMKTAKGLISANNRRDLSMRNSDAHYMFLMRFGMEFRRLANTPLNQVSATLGVEAFHHIQTQLDNYLESARAEKAEAKRHGAKARYAVAAYKELLMTLQWMDQSGSAEDRTKSDEIKRHIFYVTEYRDLSAGVLRKYQPAYLSKAFLRDLVLATHVYMRLLEQSAKAGNIRIVQRKRRRTKRPRKQKKTTNEETETTSSLNFDQLEPIWNEMGGDLSDLLQGHDLPSVGQSPFDATLDVDDDMHKKFAMVRVQRALREKRPADALAVYRAARDVWPDDDTFGARDIEPEDEFLELHDIHFADLQEVEKQLKEATEKATGGSGEQDGQQNGGDIFDDEADGALFGEEWEGSDDEEVEEVVETETPFDFVEFAAKFARSDVLKWYVFLLKDWQTNTMELNKALVKMLHRVAFDLKMPSRLYQASLLRIFENIATKPALAELENAREVHRFGKYLLRRFFADLTTVGPKLICELLFWKGPRECYEIEHGYGTFETRDTTGGKAMLWSEELDNELRTLHEEYVAMEEKPEDIDVADFVEHNLSQPRNRKQIIRQLKQLGLHSFGARPNKRIRSTAPRQKSTKPRQNKKSKGSEERFVVRSDDDDENSAPIHRETPSPDAMIGRAIDDDDDRSSSPILPSKSSQLSSASGRKKRKIVDESDDDEKSAPKSRKTPSPDAMIERALEDDDDRSSSPILRSRSSQLSSASTRKKRKIVDESEESDDSESTAEKRAALPVENDDSDFEPLPSGLGGASALAREEEEDSPTASAPLSELQPSVLPVPTSEQRRLSNADSDDDNHIAPRRSVSKKRKIVISDSEDSD